MSIAPATKPVIIGLTGAARSGKDSVGRIMVDLHDFRRVAFGDTLKAVAEDVNPAIAHGRFNVLGDRMGTDHTPVVDLLKKHGGWEGLKDAVPESRQFLVDLGNSLRVRIPGIEISASFGGLRPGDRVVNTNVYHGEEISAIRAMGGKVVRVYRDGFGPANEDEARTLLHDVDATLHNSGDLNTLRGNVAAMLRELGIPSTAAAAAAPCRERADYLVG